MPQVRFALRALRDLERLRDFLHPKSSDVVELTLFLIQELIRRNTGLLEDRTKCALGHIARMIGNSSVSVGLCVVPDLVTTSGLAVKIKAKRLEMFSYIPVTEPP